jgi:hypothetical protein
VNFYQLPLEKMLVAVDDADLPLGEIRLRPAAAAAGITGWSPSSSISATREFARLRIGIGRGRRAGDHRPRARRFSAGRSGAAGKSFGTGGRPGGMLAGRRNCKRQ